jgi:soluble lytic murein transglycosylase
MVYSVVRTESAFDQRDTSPANAVGLMQVTPEAGRDTAQRFGVAYDWKRLVSDPVYNTQMGAAEISALFREYTGSYIYDVCRLQCRPRPRPGMGCEARRPT